MPKVIHPFNPGDYIINWVNFKSDKNFIDTLKKSVDEELYWCPSDDHYIHEMQIFEVLKLDKGNYWVRDVFDNTSVENTDKTIRHDLQRIWKLDKVLVQNLMKKYPLKAKLKDKIINPYLLMKNKDINAYDEYKYNLDINLESKGRRVNITSDNRSYYAKSVPFVEVCGFETRIFYNIKYKRFLNYLETNYLIQIDNDEVRIDGYLQNDNLNTYKPFSSIWSDVCTSPSPVISSTPDGVKSMSILKKS